MKPFLATVMLALVAGAIGGIGSRYFIADYAPVESTESDDAGSPPDAGRERGVHTEPAGQLATLEERIAVLEAQVARQQGTTARDAVTGTAASAAGAGPAVSEREALLRAGIHPDTVDEVLNRLSRQEFRKLELQNLIRRSDIPDKRPYVAELSELNRTPLSLRTELGDEAYDGYLVASGQDNRVRVVSVMPGSPAEANGIQVGDIILRYGGEPIFSWRDLHEATTQGAFGTFANVEIERDGMPMNIVVPRGVLGVRAEPVRSVPGLP